MVLLLSRSIRHQDDLYADVIEATTYNAKDTIYFDDDDVDIIDIITAPITASSSSSTTSTIKKKKRRDLT